MLPFQGGFQGRSDALSCNYLLHWVVWLHSMEKYWSSRNTWPSRFVHRQLLKAAFSTCGGNNFWFRSSKSEVNASNSNSCTLRNRKRRIKCSKMSRVPIRYVVLAACIFTKIFLIFTFNKIKYYYHWTQQLKTYVIVLNKYP